MKGKEMSTITGSRVAMPVSSELQAFGKSIGSTAVVRQGAGQPLVGGRSKTIDPEAVVPESAAQYLLSENGRAIVTIDEFVDVHLNHLLPFLGQARPYDHDPIFPRLLLVQFDRVGNLGFQVSLGELMSGNTSVPTILANVTDSLAPLRDATRTVGGNCTIWRGRYIRDGLSDIHTQSVYSVTFGLPRQSGLLNKLLGK